MSDINVFFEGEVISEKHQSREGYDILVDMAEKLNCHRIEITSNNSATFCDASFENIYLLTIEGGDTSLDSPSGSKIPSSIDWSERYDYRNAVDYVSSFLKFFANDEDYKSGVKLKLSKLTNELTAIKNLYGTIVGILSDADKVNISSDDHTLIDFCMNGLKCQIKYCEHRGVTASIETGTANDGISSKATSTVDLICKNIGALSKYASKDKIYEVFKQLK